MARISSTHEDRALGAVLASAAGDALGAPYEFGPAVLPPTPIAQRATGTWQLGEWTDDTAMAVPILRALAAGRSLHDEAALDAIVAEWRGWASDAKDVGIQTRSVLSGMAAPTAAGARAGAERIHRRTGRSGGNGSLMRTGPVALGFLGDRAGAAAAARAISDLTHFDVDAGDASVLWTVAIVHAIETGELHVEQGIAALPVERRQRWRDLIAEAEQGMPWEQTAKNGWVVGALQGAWSAIVHGTTLEETLELAVRCGNDTDTVAAIAGSLAGARYGVSALPWRLQRHLHGWMGEGEVGDRRTLLELAVAAMRGGADARSWPAAPMLRPDVPALLVEHPADEGVLLGDLAALAVAPATVGGVVSLCRVGGSQAPVARAAHAEIRLIDQDGKNPHLVETLIDAADAVAALRAEGRQVLLHCHESRSRTAAVAAVYAIRHRDAVADEALEALRAAMPRFAPKPFLLDAVRRIAAEVAR